jgi:tRNA(Ile)-lysidine synthase
MEKVSLIERIRRTVEEHRMLPGLAAPGGVGPAASGTNSAPAQPSGDGPDADAPAQPSSDSIEVLLMVSGGSDSVALLRLLPRLYPWHNYTVLHINHQLRGEQADEDERFVVELAATLGLRCEVRRADIAALAAREGGNIEQLGRHVRYREANALLSTLCARPGSTAAIGPGSTAATGRIVTAHTLNDRVETFFMRAIVGAGSGALASIPFVNGPVIRPLLACTRDELREWLRGEARDEHERSGKGEGWREDATNKDRERLRGFVRHELIPRAQMKNPELLRTVARSLDTLGCDDAFLARLAATLEERFVSERDGILSVDAALFNEDPALVRRVIRAACKRVLPLGERLSFEHIAHIAAQGNRVGFVTDITGAVTVANEYGTLVIRRRTEVEERSDEFRESWKSWEATLGDGLPQRLPDGRLIEFARVDFRLFCNDPLSYARENADDLRVFIDGEALERSGGVLRVSYLQPGDRFCPLGMNGHHRLVSDVLIDCKVLRGRRATMCKVSTAGDVKGDIVWVIGLRLDDRFKVSSKTTSMFSIIVTG